MTLLFALLMAFSPMTALVSTPTNDSQQEVKCWVVPIVGERICI